MIHEEAMVKKVHLGSTAKMSSITNPIKITHSSVVTWRSPSLRFRLLQTYSVLNSANLYKNTISKMWDVCSFIIISTEKTAAIKDKGNLKLNSAPNPLVIALLTPNGTNRVPAKPSGSV